MWTPPITKVENGQIFRGTRPAPSFVVFVILNTSRWDKESLLTQAAFYVYFNCTLVVHCSHGVLSEEPDLTLFATPDVTILFLSTNFLHLTGIMTAETMKQRTSTVS
jgi:hypothetical protein